MKINVLQLLYGLIVALLFATCVREIDFKNDVIDKADLVISGGFYNGAGPFSLRLMHPTNYDKRDFEPVTGAIVTLSDDDGHQYFYSESDPVNQKGVYLLIGATGVPGRTYTLEIQLPDGKTYRSRPQKMPEPLPVDAAEMRFAFVEDINAQGNIVKIPFAQVYAHVTVPDQAAGRYFRWECESTFIFDEIDTGNPFDPPKQCFISNYTSNQVVGIDNPADFQPGTQLVVYAGRRAIDFAFDLRNCFSVYQRTIGKDAFLYWKRVKQVVEPTGTIFDLPPSFIPGNLENVNDPGRPAFGFFEVGASDTARVFANRGDLPSDVVAFIPKHCSGPQPCNPNNNPRRPECCECLLLPNSTLQKPEWW
ncbi:MAG: DUF4249 domain-containing protein [Lewinellaceae bacterium]|nr:DUF4249 domain-containing protein [Lewinellaceae bacterium]